MEKKTNKAKLEIFKFLRKSAESQGYSAKSYGFHENAKIIENDSFLLVV